MKRYIRLLLPFFILFIFNSSIDAQSGSPQDLRKISGTITYLGKPVENVNISIRGRNTGTRTNSSGYYEIEAGVGETLKYSHVSYQEILIVIEDVTYILNLSLKEKINLLDEALVTAKPASLTLSEFEEKMDVELQTSFGIFRPNTQGTKVHYLSGEDLGSHYTSLSHALMGKFSGKLPGVYDVDGLRYTDDTFIDISIIKDLFVTKNIIVIRTMASPEEIERKKEQLAEQYRNQNYYQSDALPTSKNKTFTSSELNKSINGQVTHSGLPLSDVNIIIRGTSKGTMTDSQGYYSIDANVGEVLQFSYVGMKTVSVRIENITSVLNVELEADTNQLDEAVVKARKKVNSVSELERKMAVEIALPFGNIIPAKSGFDVRYIPGRDLNPAGGLRSLAGKIGGLVEEQEELKLRGKAITWMVDGMQGPITNVIAENIADIYVIKNAPGIGPVIAIYTNAYINSREQKPESKLKKLQNDNFYINDAREAEKDELFSSAVVKKDVVKKIIEKNISGRVTYIDDPMHLVNIKVVGRNAGVVTNPNGEYKIKANVGDIIQFSHIGYATMSVVVEETTEVLNIEMVLKENELDTVILEADSYIGKTAERAKKSQRKFNSSRGNFDPQRSGNAISYIDGNEKTAGARDILDVLNGKVAGIRVNRETNEVYLRSTGSINTDLPPIWDVDGNIITYIPNIPPDDIEDIYLLKSLAATNRYGSEGRGGVIVVRTRTGSFSAANAKQNEKIAEQYRNQDFYANDASDINLASLDRNVHADGLEAFETKQKAFIHYQEKLRNRLPSYGDHIAIARKFVTYFKDLTLSTEIFKGLIEKHKDNPEILKAIAYHLQAIGKPREAIRAYEKAFKLRPKYAQSYRDLANAYMENNQFKKSWRMYMSYLMQGADLNDEGIGDLIYNEMEWLYFNRKNQTQIRETFVPRSKDIFEFRNDVRVIVEWNTSEAEFDLEFVNPDFRSYVFEHTLVGNQELITREKQIGYSSKTFYIEDIGDGEWLMNITYKGNKKPEPTYFKLTTFYNWGKAEQEKEIGVYKFEDERNKIQLKKFTGSLLSSDE